MLRNARHTLSSNIIQQLCAGLLLLFLPNILTKENYAQVVFIGVLLSFIEFADLGMSRVYSRIAPALLSSGNNDTLKIWDNSALTFGLITSCLYSLLAASIYYYRYGDVLNTTFLLPVPLILFWLSFCIGHAAVRSEFRSYLKANSWRAIASLTALPLVYLIGLTGFFLSNLLAVIIGLMSFGKKIISPQNIHWPIITTHLKEGILVSLTSILSMNLMNFARFYASTNYQPEDIATYGIVCAAWSSIFALVIALFLPATIEMRVRHEKSEGSALEFAGETIKKATPYIWLGTLFAIICSPFLFHLCFPSYRFNSDILAITFIGAIFHSLLTIYANLIIIRKKFYSYLLAVIISTATATASAYLIDQQLPIHGAAWGQFIGILTYTLILFSIVSHFSSTHSKKLWKTQTRYLTATLIFAASTVIIAQFL